MRNGNNDDKDDATTRLLSEELQAYLAQVQSMSTSSLMVAKSKPRALRPSAELISLVDKIGLDLDQLEETLRAICQTPYANLGLRSLPLLIPKSAALEKSTVEIIVFAFSTLGSSLLRSSLVKWLVACRSLWTREAKQFMRDSYAVWFGFINHLHRLHLCRLLHLLTHRQDVTPWRCRVLSQVLQRDTSFSPLALAELFARFAPRWIKFPTRFFSFFTKKHIAEESQT